MILEPYLIIALIGMIFFHKVIYLKYCVDDPTILIQVKAHKATGKFKFTYIRKFFYGAGLFKNPSLDHCFSIIIHITNTMLIYKATSSLLVACLWLLNPVNNQLSLWLNGRRYSIGILCTLLVFNFPVFFVPVYAFIAWFHVYAIALPFIIIATYPEYWAIIPSGITLYFVFGFKNNKAMFKAREKDMAKSNEFLKIKPQKLILYVKSLGWYFGHTLFPSKPMMYQDFLFYFGKYEVATQQGYKLNRDFWKGFLVVAFLVYEIGFQHNIWAVWWLVFISQYSNLVTVVMSATDRYCSLAGIGLMAILGKYLILLPTPFSYIAIGAFFAYYTSKYQPLFNAYQSIRSFYMYHILMKPNLIKPRAYLAHSYLGSNEPFAAHYITNQGLKFRPWDFELQVTMAKIMFAIGQHDKCIKTMDRALENCPMGEEELAKTEFDEIKKIIMNPPQIKQEQNFRISKQQMKGLISRHKEGLPIEPALAEKVTEFLNSKKKVAING